jgi:4-aminobutyrate aminotransferase-like enzyme
VTRLLSSMSAPGQRHALQAVRGRGTRLTLEDGRTVIDAGAMSANLLGHCHPEVVAAVQAAAETVNVGDMVGYPPREQAADDLLDLAFRGEDWASSVAFFVSSSEACDLGLGLAQMLSGRDPLVCRGSGYHGGVGLAREVSHHPMWDTGLSALAGGFQPRPSHAVTREIPVPKCGRAFQPEGHSCAGSCLAGAAEALDGAAAVIMDYSQGGIVPSPQYQDTLANMARAAGALWVADETVTGFGRMGHEFAFQRGSTRPDMVTMGKGITGGAVPCGALVLSQDLVDAIGPRRWMTSSTYRGHPLAVAAISAVMRVIDRERLVERAARLGVGLGRDLQSIAASHPCVRTVIGEGLSWLIHVAEPDRALDEDEWRGDGQHDPLCTAVHRAVLDEGVLIPEFSGERLWIVPPLVISEDDLAAALAALDTALAVGDRMLEQATAVG